MKIHDGTGTGNEAKVDSNNRLHTDAVTNARRRQAALEENAFELGTGEITLTSANTSAVLYFKNNETKDFVIDSLEITCKNSTGGAIDSFLVELLINPTGLSAGTSTSAVNMNFGSSKTLTADITIGQEAATVTGGTVSGLDYAKVDMKNPWDLVWVVPKGSSFALRVTPPASNTSLPLIVRAGGHLESEDK